MTVDIDVLDVLLKEIEELSKRARDAVEAGRFVDDLPDYVIEAIEKAAKIKATFALEIAESQDAIDRLTQMLERSMVHQKIMKHRAYIEQISESDDQISVLIAEAGRMLIELEGIIEEDRQEE